MPDLRQTRNRLTVIAAVLIVVNLVCAAMLVTPIAGAENSRREQMNQLWATLKACERSPSRGVDKKIPQARKEISDFYHDRLPDAYSAISTDLDKIGTESGVKVSGERYTEKDAEIEGLQRVVISADVSGDYLQIVHFINGLERSKLFFMVDGLELGSEQTGTIKLQINLETYLRTT